MLLSLLFVLQSLSLTQYVDPFIGTGGHGHTFPGATCPFGMVQLSPDTRLTGWDGCSGYHHSDSIIYGFSHTHLSGTGVSDYGDVLIMPFSGDSYFHNGADEQPGYRSKFNKETERASPGYYRVFLEKDRIEVELTTGLRSGVHRYQYAQDKNRKIIIDLEHRDQLLEHRIQQLSKNEISGKRYSSAWATDQRLHFYLRSNFDIKETLYNEGRTKVIITFEDGEEPLLLWVGVSYVDEEGARRNLEEERRDRDFDQMKVKAEKLWERELNKIQVKSQDRERLTIFYTALYHTMIAPNLFSDFDGRYRGMDNIIHQTHDHDQYTVFSLWDTYRATHPLYTIIDQKRTRDFIHTFLNQYKQGGQLPMWELAGNYTGCMIGYHAVPVISDAYMKSISGFDDELALRAMISSSKAQKLGIPDYIRYGFVPAESEAESVSKTLEYAYDDWTIARMAEKMNEHQVASEFYKRAQFYKNVFDPNTGFMRARLHNTWFSPFDPAEVNHHYTEANAWQYSYYVPHDIQSWTGMLGGRQALERKLDDLFSATPNTTGRDQADITGLIGQYAHGNEPSHHIAYLYNWTSRPDKTQSLVQQIMRDLYSSQPDGYSGNEDCGQMSAWLVFSAMGFYPVTPGRPEYVLGSPWFEEVTIHLENGNSWKMTAENWDPDHLFIEGVLKGDVPYQKIFLNHHDIMSGGEWTWILSDTPSTFGSQWHDQAPSRILGEDLVTTPYFEVDSRAFSKSKEIYVGCTMQEAQIFYQINDESVERYTEPFTIQESCTVSIWAEKPGHYPSQRVSTSFYKRTDDYRVVQLSTYGNHYSAGGQQALVDGILGGRDYRTGPWQGFEGRDLEAVVDLGRSKKVESINMRFIQDENSWIFMPQEVVFYGSKYGRKYNKLGSVKTQTKWTEKGSIIEDFEIQTDKKMRFVKIEAKSLKYCPVGHKGEGGKCWIFADEIIIN